MLFDCAEIFNALAEGFLNISVALILFVGIHDYSTTRVKQLVCQETPATLKPANLVNHEIYLRAQGNVTVKKAQPNDFDNVLQYAFSTENPVSSQKNETKPTATSVSKWKQAIHFVMERIRSQHSKQRAVGSTNFPVVSHPRYQASDSSVSTPTIKSPAYYPTTSLLPQSDINTGVFDAKNVMENINVERIKKQVAQYYVRGHVEFFHVLECGSDFLHMREILKIFARNVTVCSLVTDRLNKDELQLLVENKTFASEKLIIGSHGELLDTHKLKVVPLDNKELKFSTAAKIIEHTSHSRITKIFPFTWYLFGFKLRQVMAHFNQNILSVSNECMILAKKLKMDRPTVEAALQHLTEQNMILYFKNILNDYVFSGINFFSHFFSHLYNSRCEDCSQPNSELAVIGEPELERIIEYVCNGKVAVKDFVSLLKKLLILAPYDTTHTRYVLPSLMEESKVDNIHLSFHTCACIKCPSTGYEFITMLMVYLLTHTSNDWTIDSEITGVPVCEQYKNRIQFLMRASHSFVFLSFSNGILKIYADDNVDSLGDIGSAILQGLEQVKLILHISKSFNFNICFICPCENFDYEHMATFNKHRKTLICDINNEAITLPSQDLIYKEKWLKSEYVHIGESWIITAMYILHACLSVIAYPIAILLANTLTL